MDINRKLKMIKRMMIICWCILFVCFIIKMIGYNLFEMAWNNPAFHKICDFIDNTFLIYILDFIFYTIGNILFLLIYNSKITFKQMIIYNLLFSLYWVFKFLVGTGYILINTIIYDIIDILVLFIILIVSSKKILLPILTVILMIIFTLVSSLTKNIGLSDVFDKSAFMVIVFHIDYYIMLSLSALYSYYIRLKKEVL